MLKNDNADSALAKKTIEDFGDQWTTYSDTSGYFGSAELFSDFVAPFDVAAIANAVVIDIGAGTGRHVDAMLSLGARHVYAVEPSESISVVQQQFLGDSRVTLINDTGDKLHSSLNVDLIFSIWVIHHIPQPAPVIRAAFHALKPGGKFVVWLYGKEGNRLYLMLALPLRIVTRRLSRRRVASLAWLLNFPLSAYIKLCRYWPGELPLKSYMLDILGNLSPSKRRVVIYDQLKPAYTKYYSKSEALELMQSAPFNVESFHRRGYSWLMIGTKPIA